jgi:hypothetical protein
VSVRECLLPSNNQTDLAPAQCPNQRARRRAPKPFFLRHEFMRRSLQRALRLRARKEVNVDAADEPRTELHVAGAAPVVRAWPASRYSRARIAAATTRDCPSEKTPAFGTLSVATSPIG